MARDTQRDSTSAPNQSQTARDAGTNQPASPSTTVPQTDRTERQRSIDTGRETPKASAMTRRPPAAAMRGLAASPFSLMRRMAEDMDRLFDNVMFGTTGFGTAPSLTSIGGPGSLEQAAWSPQVETFRRGDKLVVRADLPGLKKEDLHVDVEDGALTISGERSEEQEETRDDFYRSERSYGQFYRAIPLPEGVSADQCEATFKDGVLEVTLPAPKQSARGGRRIQIR